MNCMEKSAQLASIINSTLPEIVGTKCVFLDLPYYKNIGDVLIWEGTEWFIKNNNINCIYSASKDTFDWRDFPEDATILLQGGGNFGDLWLPHQEFRLNVISHYRNNKIVILPQTVFYKDPVEMKKQAGILAEHPNLIICARDRTTEELLKCNFKNEIVLLPDMAFCIPSQDLQKMALPVCNNKYLFLKRNDAELLGFSYESYIHNEVEVHDWPSYENTTSTEINYFRLFNRRNILKKLHLGFVVDLYAKGILKNHYIKSGTAFLSQYNYIYTTRLHVAILSTLLGKSYTFFDNSYGKNSEFYNTWLKDTDGITFIS